MNVVFFMVNKIEASTRGTFSLIAIELKNDGQRTLSDQELDGPSWPSWRAEMKVQRHMYAVLFSYQKYIRHILMVLRIIFIS